MDKIFLRLSEKWALGYDPSQWIVMHWRPPYWRAVSFVSSSKVVLERVLREDKVVIDPEARAALNHLPESYREWFEAMEQDQPDREAAE